MDAHLEAVNSPSAPQPIGPYSQAIKSGDYLFCSGQIALDPETGTMKNDSIESETKQVLQNLAAVLSASGASFSHLVKTTIFLTDLQDFGKVNQIYETMIGGARPARSTVQVAALPKGAKVEIECIAFLR